MKCLMLAGMGESTKILYNFLSKKIKIDALILEKPKNKSTFLKRRIKKLGFCNVLGQILFKVLVVPVIKTKSQKRMEEIYAEYSLNNELDYAQVDNCFFVNDASSFECEELIKQFSPDIIIINGTSIIKENILNCTCAKIINIHAGITPKYRGVHGAYWALYNNDIDNCGVTVHFVNKGIDTGDIIYQQRIVPKSSDNFCTYPTLQLATALNMHYQAILDIKADNVKTISNSLPSKLYYHPTIWQYLYGRIVKKVK